MSAGNGSSARSPLAAARRLLALHGTEARGEAAVDAGLADLDRQQIARAFELDAQAEQARVVAQQARDLRAALLGGRRS